MATCAFAFAYTPSGSSGDSGTIYSSGSRTYADIPIVVTTGPHTMSGVVYLTVGVTPYTLTVPANTLPNAGTVPAGYITINVRVWYLTTDPSQFSFEAEMVFTAITSYTTGLYFNTTELVNGNINNIDNSLGGKTWDISGFSDDYSKIEAIMAFASPLDIGNSVSGYQYVRSRFSPGSLIVQSETPPKTYTINDLCYIQSPVAVEKFGQTYFYSLKVVQSSFSNLDM